MRALVTAFLLAGTLLAPVVAFAEDAPAAADLGEALLTPEGADMLARLQQVTGAAIAKAQEDTAFYRWIPLLSSNEVGAEPDEALAVLIASNDVAAAHALTIKSLRPRPNFLAWVLAASCAR